MIVISGLLILLSITTITQTLAWFKTKDEVNNTFTIGSVEVLLHEQEYDDNHQLQNFTQNQYLYPIINPSNPQEDIYYVDKLVSVENIGKNDAYIRTFFAIPYELYSILTLDLNLVGWNEDSIQWSNTMMDGIEYKVISYTYEKALHVNETTDYLLCGMFLNSDVDIKENEDSIKQFCTLNSDGTYTFYNYDINQPIHVYVATQACQTRGLSSNPIEALNEAFGKIAPF